MDADFCMKPGSLCPHSKMHYLPGSLTMSIGVHTLSVHPSIYYVWPSETVKYALANCRANQWGRTSHLSSLTHEAKSMEERMKQAGWKWLTVQQAHLFTNTTKQSISCIYKHIKQLEEA